MQRATSCAILGSLARGGVWGGGSTWVHRPVEGGFGEKRGWCEITPKCIKRGGEGGWRPESAPFIIFLDSMDPELSFKVYYSSRDPLVAALEFFENSKILPAIRRSGGTGGNGRGVENRKNGWGSAWVRCIERGSQRGLGHAKGYLRCESGVAGARWWGAVGGRSRSEGR